MQCFFCFFLVSSCDQLTCGANEICVSAGGTYECICLPDYEGENCHVKGPYNLITTSFNQLICRCLNVCDTLFLGLSPFSILRLNCF